AGFVTTAVISASGQYVTYISFANDLVPNQTFSNPNGPTPNVFRYDKFSGTNILLSGVATQFGPSGSITSNGVAYVLASSADGNNIAFVDDSTNLFPAP